MRNYISSDIFQYRGILLLASGKKLIFFTISCMMRVINCEGMTSSPHWNEYSWGLVKNCFPKIWKISKINNFLIFYSIFMGFVPFCRGIFSLVLWNDENFGLDLPFNEQEKFTQEFMHIYWMKNNFRIITTTQVWANLDYPIKRYDFSKFWLISCLSSFHVAQC